MEHHWKLVTKKTRKEVYRPSSLNGENPEDTYVPSEYLPKVTSEDYFLNNKRIGWPVLWIPVSLFLQLAQVNKASMVWQRWKLCMGSATKTSTQQHQHGYSHYCVPSLSTAENTTESLIGPTHWDDQSTSWWHTDYTAWLSLWKMQCFTT